MEIIMLFVGFLIGIAVGVLFTVDLLVGASAQYHDKRTGRFRSLSKTPIGRFVS